MKTVVESVTDCVAPALVGVMLNEDGLAPRPCTAGTDTLHVTIVDVPLVSVATTFGVVLIPAATLACVGFQTTV